MKKLICTFAAALLLTGCGLLKTDTETAGKALDMAETAINAKIDASDDLTEEGKAKLKEKVAEAKSAALEKINKEGEEK